MRFVCSFLLFAYMNFCVCVCVCSHKDIYLQISTFFQLPPSYRLFSVLIFFAQRPERSISVGVECVESISLRPSSHPLCSFLVPPSRHRERKLCMHGARQYLRLRMYKDRKELEREISILCLMAVRSLGGRDDGWQSCRMQMHSLVQ